MPPLRRTQLATPASDPGMMASAADTAADEVFLDLEDSVAPAEKEAARELLIEAVAEHDWSGTILAYRINGLDTQWWYNDLITVVEAVGASIDDIIVPKVSSADELATVDRLLTTIERNADLTPGGIGLEPQIEDGAGMHNAYEIATASDRLASLIFGPGDYAAAMGTPGLDIGQFPEYPGHYWHYALSHVNAAAKAAGVPCIDGPYADIEDEAGFRQSAQRARQLGCDGKWVIHPAQIEIGNDVFAPDPAVAERAQRIVNAYEEAQAAGKGAVEVDGQMVDEATNKMASEIVERAEQADRL